MIIPCLLSSSTEADKALHGTERANLASMIEGVTDGYVKKLTLVGVGSLSVITPAEVEMIAIPRPLRTFGKFSALT